MDICSAGESIPAMVEWGRHTDTLEGQGGSDMDRTLKFWQEMFGVEILFDMEIAGAWNVFIL